MRTIESPSWAVQEAAMEITIPPWMYECAPGAVQAAQDIISTRRLTEVQRKRLKELLGNDMELAWRELAAWRGKEKPTLYEQVTAQYALFYEVFWAPDRLLTDEVSQFKADLAEIGRLVAQAARIANGMMANPHTAMRTTDMWQLFGRNHESNPAMADLPEDVMRVRPCLSCSVPLPAGPPQRQSPIRKSALESHRVRRKRGITM